MLDAFCLPTAGASTQEPWLQTEIPTRCKAAPPWRDPPRLGTASSSTSDNDANLVAVPTPGPPTSYTTRRTRSPEMETRRRPRRRRACPKPPHRARVPRGCCRGARRGSSASSFFLRVRAHHARTRARESAYFLMSRAGNPNTIAGGLSLISVHGYARGRTLHWHFISLRRPGGGGAALLTSSRPNGAVGRSTPRGAEVVSATAARGRPDPRPSTAAPDAPSARSDPGGDTLRLEPGSRGSAPRARPRWSRITPSSAAYYTVSYGPCPSKHRVEDGVDERCRRRDRTVPGCITFDLAPRSRRGRTRSEAAVEARVASSRAGARPPRDRRLQPPAPIEQLHVAASIPRRHLTYCLTSPARPTRRNSGARRRNAPSLWKKFAHSSPPRAPPH